MRAEKWRQHLPFWFAILIALLCVALGFQGSRGLWEPDEGYYVSTALQMHETGDLLIPRLNHEPFLEKPPITYWGIVGGLSLLGHNEWAVRFFHSICFLLTIVAVYFLGSSVRESRREGFVSALIYGTMGLPFAAANVVTPDTPLVLWTTLACYCFWQSVKPGAAKVAMWKLLLCSFLGVGFMTKGTAALIPTGGMFLYLVLTRQVGTFFFTLWALPGLAIFAILGLTWYYKVGMAIPAALEYFWINQVWGRTVADQYGRNPGLVKGLAIYIPALLFGTLPWSLFWYARPKRAKSLLTVRAWKRLREQDRGSLFLLCWVFVTFTILVLSSSKLILYILPAFPAMAVGLSKPVARVLTKPGEEEVSLTRGWSFGVAALIVILLAARFIVATSPSEKDSRAFWNSVKDYVSQPAVELVLVDEKRNGLRFYGAENIETVTTSDDPHPFFSKTEPLEEEVEELKSTDIRHMFLCKNSKRAEKTREMLKESEVVFREVSLPFDRVLMMCEPPKMPDDVIRFAALGDAGSGESSQVAISSALYLLNGEKSLSGGVILLGDNFFPNPEEMAQPNKIFEKYFETPYHSLLDMDVPFYGVLGNHDYRFAFEKFEIDYPALNFQGNHYYSKIFGENLVELFVLDSQRLIFNKQECSKQLNWLANSLDLSKAKWKMVAVHHPLYSTAKQHPSNPYLISKLEPLFERYKVDIVLQGHNHVYERLVPVHGIHYFTVGSGGRLRVGDLDPQHANGLAMGNDTKYMFLTLEFHRDRCGFVAYDMMRNIVDQGTIHSIGASIGFGPSNSLEPVAQRRS